LDEVVVVYGHSSVIICRAKKVKKIWEKSTKKKYGKKVREKKVREKKYRKVLGKSHLYSFWNKLFYFILEVASINLPQYPGNNNYSSIPEENI
jgi:hypothetical protein